MYGYIYITTNLINGRMYIGKHKSEKYDSSYYGSGKILLYAIKKYGIENFSNSILDTAECLEELNEKEKYYIGLYREKYKDKLYNIANGGDGGNTFENKSQDEKDDFIEKMTTINQQRCASDKFKQLTSLRMRKKYSDPLEREKQSKKITEAWSSERLRNKQSIRLKEYYKTHKKDCRHNNIPCIFELNGVIKEFDKEKELKKYLKEEYNYAPSNPRIKQLLINGSNGIKFESFFSKHNNLNGMLLYYKQNENVETMGDECSPVGCEIGTHSKRKTEIEEIVHAV